MCRTQISNCNLIGLRNDRWIFGFHLPRIATTAITTGGFVVESVFAIPGLGRYFVQAVQQSDYTVIMGTTVFYGAFLVFMVIVVDLLYAWVDPRVRLE